MMVKNFSILMIYILNLLSRLRFREMGRKMKKVKFRQIKVKILYPEDMQPKGIIIAPMSIDLFRQCILKGSMWNFILGHMKKGKLQFT